MNKWISAGICLLFVNSLMAQDTDPFVDGAGVELDRLPKLERGLAVQRAPHIPAFQVALPRTVLPEPEEQQPGFRHPILDVGYILPAPDGLLMAARWNRLPDGSRIARMELSSENAAGLRLQFHGQLDPATLELRVYEPGGKAVFGPVRPYTDEDGTWWAPTVWGNSIGLEFYVPASAPFPPQMPTMVAVGYMHTPFASDFMPAELGCHLDVTCYPAYNNEKAAVAKMIFPTGGGNFGGCTGELLNRAPQDLAPIFMTARHCISTQSSANGLELYWFYQSSVCNGAPPNLNSVPRTDGSLLLKHHGGSDWTILGLYEPPAGNYWLGWDSNNWGSGDNSVVIHHPDGAYKRISFGPSRGGESGCGFTVWGVDYAVGNGTIEGGSSGSTVLDSNRRARGPASCATFPWQCPPIWCGYGRLSAAFTNVQYYIWQMASPTYVNRAVAGDANNEGNSERGTAANPFNTVYEGTFCVQSNDRVIIQAGNYNERFTLWRPMRLESQGGVARIGAP